MSNRVAGQRPLPRPQPIGGAGSPLQAAERVLAAAAAHALTVRVSAKGGPQLLAPADLKRIATDPSLLASEFHVTLDVQQLAEQLDGATAWAQKGAQIDLIAEGRHADDRMGLPGAPPGVRGAAPPAPGTEAAFSVGGSTPATATAPSGSSLDELVAGLVASTRTPAAPQAGTPTDAQLWRGLAAAVGVAGGSTLRAMVNDPTRRANLTARWARLFERTPAVNGIAAPSIAAALTTDLFELYARVPQARLQQLRPLLLGPNLSDASHQMTGRLLHDAGFWALSAGQQQRLLRVVDGSDSRYSRPIQTALQALLSSASYQALAPQARAEAITTLLDGWPPNDWPILIAEDAFAANQAHFTLTGPVSGGSVAFVSGTAPAQRYDLHFGALDIPVQVPADPNPVNGNWPTVQQVAQGLAAMPSELRAELTEIQLDPGRNPADAHWAQVYGEPGFRSYMTANSNGLISIYPVDSPSTGEEVEQTLIHETGHVLSDQMFGNALDDPRWNQWERAMAADPIAASGYARASPAEDFSETLVLYVAVRNTPQEEAMRWLFPQRFAILDRLLASTGES